MNDINLKLWSNITFKTQGYRKNFDLVNDDENIITEYEGCVSEIRIANQKPPLIIGEYGFSVWDIELGIKFGANLNKLITERIVENTYSELIDMAQDKEIEIKDFKKIVFIHSFILRKDYRKCGITEEFIEMIYRDFYYKNTAIIALIKPFQNNYIDADYYYNRKSVQVKENLKLTEIINVPAFKYYSLDELTKKKDTEINEYKLFTIANKCGFNRINNSHLFIYSPEKTIERMLEKRKYVKSIG
jgi:hypothetical protein